MFLIGEQKSINDERAIIAKNNDSLGTVWSKLNIFCKITLTKNRKVFLLESV